MTVLQMETSPANEITHTLIVAETKEDRSAFLIAGGKSENAKRVVPLPAVAQPIVKRLRAAAVEGGHERLFHAFSINAATGTAKSAFKAFTGLRRKVLGKGTDERRSAFSQYLFPKLVTDV